MRAARNLLAGVMMLVALGAAGPLSAQTAASTRAERSLIDAEDRRFRAQLVKDVAAVDRGLADDLIYTHATGRVQSKAEVLAGIAGKGPAPRAIDAYDRTVHVFGSTGMVHGMRRTTLSDRVLVDSYLAVYVRRDRRWQLLAWQTSPPPDGPR